MKVKKELIAVIGVDKAGKTTLIRERFGEKMENIHAAPLMRKLPVTDNKTWLKIREVLFAFDRAKQYIKLRFNKVTLLDRCYIDAVVYGRYLSQKYNVPSLKKISRWFIWISPHPHVVFLLCPDPAKMVEVDDRYDDILAFNQYYRSTLFELGYEGIEIETYALGEIEIYARKIE